MVTAEYYVVESQVIHMLQVWGNGAKGVYIKVVIIGTLIVVSLVIAM